MPTKRRRESGSGEFIIRRKGLLPKPISITFPTEEEGDVYCKRAEESLDRGVVPQALLNNETPILTFPEAVPA
ncbi:MAG: hypothetical protein WC100_06160 [Sterolibacterium sp.]